MVLVCFTGMLVGKGRCATILINNMVASTHRVPPLLPTTPLLFDSLVCWLDILFFSHSAPQTRANTPSVEICRLAQQPGLHYGILFTLQPSTVLFSRGIAMATSLRRAVTMGGKSYMLSMFDILLSKYSVRGSSNWLLNKINNIFFLLLLSTRAEGGSFDNRKGQDWSEARNRSEPVTSSCT